jgi:exodeoxyribonuclease VII small subunit
MNDVDKLSFEEAFAELEQLVGQLEEGNLALEQAMALFERGMALATHCNTRLDAAELRVQQLLSAAGDYAAGKDYELAPFDESLPGENS